MRLRTATCILSFSISFLLTQIGNAALIGYYSFDNANDLGHDDSENGVDGTLLGGSSSTNYTPNGVVNGALNLTSGNDGINIPDDPVFDIQQISVAFWANDPQNNRGVLLSKDIHGNSSNTSQFHVQYSSNFGFLADSPNYGRVPSEWTSSEFTQINSGDWNHYAFTIDPVVDQVARTYFNGQLVDETPWTNTQFFDNNQPLSIGGYKPLDNLYSYSGQVDELYLYSDILSPAEVGQLYNANSVMPYQSAQLVFLDEGHSDIPGWDHVGMNLNGLIYESMPDYSDDEYIIDTTKDLEDPNNRLTVEAISGPRNQHIYETFTTQLTYGNAVRGYTGDVIDFNPVNIDHQLAEEMAYEIQQLIDVGGYGFQSLNHSNLLEIYTNLSPWAQKGGGDSFTCVGLLEWAAEEVGHNFNQGFIPNELEAFGSVVGIPHFPLFNDYDFIPFLSPFLLSVATDPLYLDNYNVLENDLEVMFGIADPIDFILTDPLGRRLGYTEDLGYINEIPGAFFSGDGTIEQFIIFDSTIGKYLLELFGKDGNANVLVGNFEEVFAYNIGNLGASEQLSLSFDVSEPVPEPATMILFGTGLAGLAGMGYRRRKK